LSKILPLSSFSKAHLLTLIFCHVCTSWYGKNGTNATSLNFLIYYKYLIFSCKLCHLHFLSFIQKKTSTTKNPFSLAMDLLSDDLIINIVARVASHSMYDLFNFQRTNQRHAALCRDPIVSKYVFTDCVPLLTDLDLTHAKLSFMNRLWDHGNPMFCILRCSQHMLHATPNFDTIRRLLSNAEAAPSNSAKYSHLLIRATALPPKKEGELLEDLWDLLVTRRISRYRVDILGGATSFRFRCTWYKRYMPPSMIRHRFCKNWLNFPEDGRRPGNFRGYHPADDDEYVLNDFCIRCRLDSEVR